MTHPDPRPDGVCCGCRTRAAVTTDGRFCRPCLRGVVASLTPDPGAFPGPGDPPADPRDSVDDPGGDWWDGAARLLEGE